ncbi:MAG: hypothetical protein HQL86_02080 [Magnetococcales bacterium]|nr:hypothetical protein [Magnetococcales bacterium]
MELEVVNREVFALVRRGRDRILAVPSRIAAEVAAETDPRAVERLLTQELCQAMIEFVNKASVL